MNHRTLVRSSVLAMTGSVLFAASANADVSMYADQPAFDAAATGAGLSQLYVETFEENEISSPYVLLTPPLASGVPNSGFPNGLTAPDLAISGENLGAVTPEPAYWPNITSTVVGTFSEGSVTRIEFGGDGVMAVGMNIFGVQSFTTNFPEAIEYTIYDTEGGELTVGVMPSPNTETGQFFGMVSDVAIGAVEINGTRFGLPQQEYVDDLEGWGGGVGPVEGDVNGDGLVDVDDLVQVILDWGACPMPPAECPSDVDGNGNVDVDDLVAVILNWS